MSGDRPSEKRYSNANVRRKISNSQPAEECLGQPFSGTSRHELRAPNGQMLQLLSAAREMQMPLRRLPKDLLMKQPRVGILDGMHGATGGAQLVAAYIATAFSLRCRVEYIHDGTTGSLKSLRQSFGLSLAGVTERVLDRLPSFADPDLGSIRRELTGEASELSAGYDLFIYSGFRVPPFCRARHGLVYCHFPFEQKLSVQARDLPGWQRHTALGRQLRALAYYPLWKYRFRGYDRVLANSDFTASWIKRRWGINADVVFPPVITTIAERPKRNLIVSVGRFTGDVKHCKRQLEQISAFRELNACMPATGSWTLRLMGFSDCKDSGAYVNALRGAAQDLPVEIVEGASHAQVIESLAEARIYWHTMGLGLDEGIHPERAEHFGIATVEAMRAGCVPVVIASGGQREIVQHRESGYLCSDLNGMVQATQSLIQNPDELAAMSKHTRERGFEFSPERFCQELSQITNRFFPTAKISL